MKKVCSVLSLLFMTCLYSMDSEERILPDVESLSFLTDHRKQFDPSLAWTAGSMFSDKRGKKIRVPRDFATSSAYLNAMISTIPDDSEISLLADPGPAPWLSRISHRSLRCLADCFGYSKAHKKDLDPGFLKKVSRSCNLINLVYEADQLQFSEEFYKNLALIYLGLIEEGLFTGIRDIKTKDLTNCLDFKREVAKQHMIGHYKRETAPNYRATCHKHLAIGEIYGFSVEELRPLWDCSDAMVEGSRCNRYDFKHCKINDLSGLSACIKELTSKFRESLPFGFSSVDSLDQERCWIQLNHNELATLSSDALSGVAADSIIDMSHNSLTALDSNLWGADMLWKLDLSNNKITKIDIPVFDTIIEMYKKTDWQRWRYPCATRICVDVSSNPIAEISLTHGVNKSVQKVEHYHYIPHGYIGLKISPHSNFSGISVAFSNTPIAPILAAMTQEQVKAATSIRVPEDNAAEMEPRE